MENEIVLPLMDVMEAMEDVAEKIAVESIKKTGRRFPYSGIVAIANGGIPFAKYLDSKFECYAFIPITIKYRDENRKVMAHPKTSGINKVMELKPPFLVVDDIIDTGITIDYLQKSTGFTLGKEFDLATLHWCQEASPNIEPTFYYKTKMTSEWIIYPWSLE